MNRDQLEEIEAAKREIIAEIFHLSGLFVKIPKVEAVDDAQSSFQNLAALIDRALDLRLVERAYIKALVGKL